MFCVNCGATLTDGKPFCPNCGTRVGTQQQPYQQQPHQPVIPRPAPFPGDCISHGGVPDAGSCSPVGSGLDPTAQCSQNAGGTATDSVGSEESKTWL